MIKKILRTVIFETWWPPAANRLANPDSPTLSDRHLETLRWGWGNRGWSANVEYLQAVIRAAASVEGHILECGSGLTTLVMGALAKTRPFTVHGLEHHPAWHARMSKNLRDRSLSNVTLHETPLVSRGKFSWYEIPDALPKDGFKLLICDGPPGDTPGGRYGVLPVMQPFLASDWVLLLDDVSRQPEQEVLQRWEKEFGVAVEIRGGERAYAVVRPGS
ncbi:MAG: hypothetical protein HKN21_08070 [Candidatus Eisenbacteria bacterium]|uniref:Class I SAM-dependent methyltransferase n=1 Tax=Eiseniibacteriota bacterium TaxID=2212470 RepID=A0A7Y2E7Q8_UNCEI|nr:hypothetical protein [Candidatus Eisenbacteria bacterium]